MNVLGQQPEFQAARADDIAAICSYFLSDQIEDRGLPRTVAADKSDVFAGIDLEGRATQNVAGAVRFVNI